MSINDVLVSDCLIQIFRYLPLQEIVLFRAVCIQWRNLIETDILPRRHSLKLFGTRGAIKEYCRHIITCTDEEIHQLKLNKPGSNKDDDDELIVDVKHFNERFCFLLKRLFPDLHRLVLWFDWDSPFKDVPTLLHIYPCLRSVSLLGTIKYDPIKEFFLLRVCQALNRMEQLTCLELMAVNMFRSEPAIQVAINRLTNILPKLSSFSLKIFGYRGDIGPILDQLGPGLRRLRLESLRFFTTDDLAVQLGSNPNLRKNLSELRISGVERGFMPVICELFTQLSYLSVGFSGLPEIEAVIVEELNRLDSLHELRLENIQLEMNLPLLELVRLPAIRRASLTGLDLGKWSFDDLRFLYAIQRAFPEVERLILRCVNSIDEREMMGAFEWAPEYFGALKQENVHLERELASALAGRFRPLLDWHTVL